MSNRNSAFWLGGVGVALTMACGPGPRVWHTGSSGSAGQSGADRGGKAAIEGGSGGVAASTSGSKATGGADTGDAGGDASGGVATAVSSTAGAATGGAGASTSVAGGGGGIGRGTGGGGTGGGGTGGRAGVGGAPEPGWLAYDLDLSVAFGTGRQIQILRTDGSCEREFIWATDTKKSVKQPAFSADGKRIAYASDSTGVFQIYVMDLMSHLSAQVTNEAQGATYPSWSPNGYSIAYVTGDPEDKYDPSQSLDGSNTSGSAVMLVDLRTLHTTALTAVGRPPYTSSSFASDKLLFVGNSISVIGIHTDTLTQDGISPTDAFFTMKSSPSISPDGSRYVFMAHCTAQTQLYTERVAGTTPPLCNTAKALSANSDGLITASWGPNGYVAAETSHHDIVLVPSDGSAGIKVLVQTTQPERNPAFAPASVALACTK